MKFFLAPLLALVLVVGTGLPAGAGLGNITDVDHDDYYAAPVQWMLDNGITTGTSASTFSPEAPVTRGMAAAFIWRMAGEPSAPDHGFVDVFRSWQDDPISWLAASEITTGVTPSRFAPDTSITRGEFAVMLWRYAGSPRPSSPHRFFDVNVDWQHDAISWMAGSGITTGTSNITFSPGASVSRGQAATFLYRYVGSPSVKLPPANPTPTTTNSSCSNNSGTTSLPSTAGRTVIDASRWTGTLILNKPNTVYDFGNVSAGRDITIAASNVEARNIRGTGARRVGQRDGRDYADSGFRDFEFTYLQTQNGGGGRLIRPYFVDGTDVNPPDYEGEGSPVHIYAYEGDVISPLIDGVTAAGWRLPEGSSAHNDGIHITGIGGGGVYDPVIRNSTVASGAAIGLLMRNVYGLVTIEGSTFSARFGALHAVLGDGEDTEALVGILWRDNTLVGGATASFLAGYELDPRSEVGSDAVVVQSR